MRFPAALLVASLALLPAAARAAELTTVLSSFSDDADPFDLTLGLAFVQQSQRATITREYQDGNGVPGAQVQDAKELAYREVKQSLEVSARMGLYKNLEMSIVLPVVLSWEVSWGLASGTSLIQSVINTNDFETGVCPRPPSGDNATSGWDYDAASNRCVPRGDTLAAGAGFGAGVQYQPLFPVDGAASFSGIGDPRFGLTWAMLDQDEDPSVPTWTLGVEYTAPLAGVRDPITATQVQGGAGSGFHVLAFTTSLSRRLRWAEPYASLRYALSLPSGRAFDGCKNPQVLATPENCSTYAPDSLWTPSETGAKPAHVGQVLFGSELTFVRGGGQRFFGDVGGLVEYHSQGRDYTQATFMLQRLTYQEEFARVGARLGLGYAPSDLVTFTIGGSYALDTAHVLTGEQIGNDTYVDPATGGTDGQVGLDNVGKELNPSYDFRFDQPGRRLRATQISGWTLAVGGAVNF